MDIDFGIAFIWFCSFLFSTTVRELASNGIMPMLGLVVAWQVFPAIASPLFSLILRVVHPATSYGP